MHCGYIIEVKELKPHLNADRLQILTCFGNDTCVGLDVKIGDKGIYFPTDLQLSVEYCAENHLCRKKADGSPDTGYMDPDKRNVTAVRLRGERSDGLYMPLSSLEFTGVNMDDLNVGDTIDIVNGVEICCKYIPRYIPRGNKCRGVGQSEGNRTRKKKVPIAPLFAEHADTEQLAYNLNAFKPGDEIEITLKMHGTSQRTGYLPVFKGVKRTFWDKLFRRPGKPIYDWGYVTGTRRTVLDNFDGGFYGSNEFREPHAKFFEGKLHKGEEVFYEVVGFTTSGAPIMGSVSNKKLNDKEFERQYGPTTIFSYGCEPTGQREKFYRDEISIFSIPEPAPQSDFYVYRMTMTNEDGDVVEYSPDFMRYRCKQIGVKCVPVFTKGYITDNYVISTTYENGAKEYYHESLGEAIKALAEQYYDGPDPIGKTHVREGVVVRIVNRPSFTAYKHKNFAFKCLSGIITEEATDVADADIASEM
jgi:hypothetical protein